MTFLEAVDRILRTNGLLKGDDDAITTFEDTAHQAAIQIAIIAAQDELNDLVSDNVLPYEVTSATITTTASSGTVALPADFVRFYGHPRLYYGAGNRPLFEYPGGRDALSLSIWNYATQLGEPNWWYLEPGTTKRLGLWQVPNAVYSYTIAYEKSVAVSVSSDVLPFHTDPEAQAFCQAAGRRFKALRDDAPDPQTFILRDPTYTTARSRLMGLMKGKKPYRRYGAVIR